MGCRLRIPVFILKHIARILTLLVIHNFVIFIVEVYRMWWEVKW